VDRFAAGQIVTVFRSALRAAGSDAYASHAPVIHELAASMPGFVDATSFTAEDGERVTIVTFADRESHDAWRTQADHVEAQQAGRRSYYERYSIQVAETLRAREWVRPSDPGA
jgi:heme-degrading monooxygenase HmoA